MFDGLNKTLMYSLMYGIEKGHMYFYVSTQYSGPYNCTLFWNKTHGIHVACMVGTRCWKHATMDCNLERLRAVLYVRVRYICFFREDKTCESYVCFFVLFFIKLYLAGNCQPWTACDLWVWYLTTIELRCSS